MSDIFAGKEGPVHDAKKEEEPSRRAAAKKKPSVFVTLISNDEDNDWVDEDFDEDDFEIEEVAAAQLQIRREADAVLR